MADTKNVRMTYQEKMHARLHQASFEIERLQTKINMTVAGISPEYHERLEVLRERQQDTRAKLDNLSMKTDDRAWEQARHELETAWKALTDTLYNRVSHFS